MTYYLLTSRTDPGIFFIYDEHVAIAASTDKDRAGIWSKKEIFKEDFPLYISSLKWIAPEFEVIMRGNHA